MINKLEQLRKHHGYTQAEVADRSGIAINTYQLYEYGERIPKIDVAMRLASVLHTTVAELFGVNDKPDSIA